MFHIEGKILSSVFFHPRILGNIFINKTKEEVTVEANLSP